MRKLLLVLVLPLLAVTLGTAVPAQARTTSTYAATLTARGGHVPPLACGYGHARYRLSVDESRIADYRSWGADITITGPHHYRDTAFVNGPTDGEGWHGVWFCKSPNRPGRYTVKAAIDITHDDSYRGSHTYQTVRTTFYVHTRR